MDAGCSLEDSCPPDQFAAFRAAHPDHIALTYINCSAEVKALSDIIVTSLLGREDPQPDPARTRRSSSAPTSNLGGYLARKTGRDMLLWPGVCIVHEAFSETELLKLKAQYPGAPVAAHPECPPVHPRSCRLCRLDQRHPRLSPTTMPGDTLIVATEPHIIHQMEKAAPDKTLHRRARRGRQLQLQHLPVHGAQHDGEALRRAARPRAAHRDRGRAAPQGEEEPRRDAGDGQRRRSAWAISGRSR